MRSWMHNQKRQPQLIRTDEFLAERAHRVEMELRIRGCEIDQIIGMGEYRLQFPSLSVFQKSGDLLALQRPGEPLHIVFHKNLHGRAVDGARSFDRDMDAAADRHVSAEKNCGLRSFPSGFRLA